SGDGSTSDRSLRSGSLDEAMFGRLTDLMRRRFCHLTDALTQGLGRVPRVTGIWSVWVPRWTVSVIVSPTLWLARASAAPTSDGMGAPSTATTTSRDRRPACSAGEPGATRVMTKPVVSAIPSWLARAGVSGVYATPMYGCETWPEATSSSATGLATLVEMAKPIPWA